MSNYAFTFPRDGVDAFFEATSAVGSEGQVVREELKKIQRASRSRATNWSVSVESEIAEIARDYAEKNWDGYGAAPVKSAALQNAQAVAAALLALLPPSIPAPDVIPEVDGDVALSWTKDRTRGFSISVGDHNHVNFAGILDKGVERHGVEIFDGSDQSVLQEIARYIARLYGN